MTAAAPTTRRTRKFPTTDVQPDTEPFVEVPTTDVQPDQPEPFVEVPTTDVQPDQPEPFVEVPTTDVQPDTEPFVEVPTTDVQPDTEPFQSFLDSYRAATNTTERNKVRNELNAEVNKAIMAFDIRLAHKAAVALASISVPYVAPIDYDLQVATRILMFRLAADMLSVGTVTPDSATVNLDRVRDLLKTDINVYEDATTLAGMAFKSAKASTSSGVTGERAPSRSLTDAIEQAVAELTGKDTTKVATINEITKAVIAIMGGPVSAGAITARLFTSAKKGCTVPHIAPVESNTMGYVHARGAVFTW